MTQAPDPMVHLTPQAVEAAKRLRSENPDWTGLDLRIYLSGKGCDGFEYGVTFDARQDLDHVQNFDDMLIVVDPDTVTFVQGSNIDWVDDERGRGFLVDNPNQKKFRGKFFKRKDWRERLEAKRQATEQAQNPVTDQVPDQAPPAL
jgi:iron-sulfur cluster assembly accessory protein